MQTVEIVFSLVLFVLGVISGGVTSWLITRHYYRRSADEARDAFIAQRLDDCNENDKTFLVALLQHKQPIPRFAFIKVEFETADARKSGWGNNTSTIIRSVHAHAPHSLQLNFCCGIDEDRQTVSLTDRGRENAEYLVRKDYRKARFIVIDDNDAQRIDMFKSEHGREPRKGAS